MVDLSTFQQPAKKEVDTAEATRMGNARAVAQHRKSIALGPAFWLPAFWLVFIIVVSALVPILGFAPPNEPDFMNLRAPIGTEGYLLGTDPLGRDLLSRVVWGGRVSLTVGFAAPAIGVGTGLVLGMLAGYYRGWVDEVIGIVIDSWLAIPGLVVLLLFSVIYGGSLLMVCVSLGLLFIPSAARITRAATIGAAQREYVMAARAMGASDFRILVREIFPNIAWPLMAFVMIDIPIAIVAEGSLSFLGLSVQAPTPSWGGMIAEGREYLETAPHLTFVPAAVMFLTVLSFNLAGDAMRKRVSGGRQGAI